jgi:hypothetical protein
MGEKPQDFENLHPRDFYRQFHRRADEDDKAIVLEAPYRIREQLRDAFFDERQSALGRATETYKKLFIDRQLAQVDQDRLYYLGKIADAANDQDRERYLTALIGRLKLSGDVGLLHKGDADRLIENVPSDLDIFTYNREYATDPARAQRLLLYGVYPNIRPELREELVKAANSAAGQASAQEVEQAEGNLPLAANADEGDHSETNKESPTSSNDEDAAETAPQEEELAEGEDGEAAVSGEQYAAATGRIAAQQQSSPAGGCVGIIGAVPGYPETGRNSWRACNDQIFIDAANQHNRRYGLNSDDPGYITPQMLKAWAMIENGGEQREFLSDPFTVNKKANWAKEKAAIAGLKYGEKMTPQKSAEAALEWMRYKSRLLGGKGTLTDGLHNYSGSTDLHDNSSRKNNLDHHPGVLHREWYSAMILELEAKMLGMARPQME